MKASGDIGELIPDQPFFRVTEAASLLRVPPATVYSWVRRGDLPGRRVGAVVLVARTDLVALLSGRAA